MKKLFVLILKQPWESASLILQSQFVHTPLLISIKIGVPPAINILEAVADIDTAGTITSSPAFIPMATNALCKELVALFEATAYFALTKLDIFLKQETFQMQGHIDLIFGPIYLIFLILKKK